MRDIEGEAEYTYELEKEYSGIPGSPRYYQR
jgi:hypothetical protein